MGRYNDNAPVGNTCSIINGGVRYIEGFKEQYDTDNADYEFDMAISVLEDIRSAKERERFIICIEELEEYVEELRLKIAF